MCVLRGKSVLVLEHERDKNGQRSLSVYSLQIFSRGHRPWVAASRRCTMKRSWKEVNDAAMVAFGDFLNERPAEDFTAEDDEEDCMIPG